VRVHFAIATALFAAGCSAAPAGTAAPRAAVELRADVIEEIRHDPEAWTQGLELVDGVLYEGTGLKGSSTMRATDPETGEVRQEVPLPDEMFGEGITVVDDTIWQLTWRDGVAIRRDRATLAETDRATYDGEGWGLCQDEAANRLIMSDGTDRLSFRDPETFAETGDTAVRDGDGEPVEKLNELECVPDQDGRIQVYANIWETDEIVRIDPASGRVTATVDLAGLLSEEEREGVDVLNGIAAVPGTDEFLVTGKLWPTLFKVRFVTANP
jgi:glutamine cyclotransferase